VKIQAIVVVIIKNWRFMNTRRTRLLAVAVVVLVNFWTTSCPGCIKEMPDLVKTWQKYHSRGLETIAVAMSYDPPEYVLQFAEKNGLPFTIALDTDGVVTQAFNNVRVTPTTFVIESVL